MTESVTTAWRFAWLLAAPHRLGFFGAALMMAVSALWWAAVLMARAMGYSPEFAVAPAAAHALLMAQGFTRCSSPVFSSPPARSGWVCPRSTPAVCCHLWR